MKKIVTEDLMKGPKEKAIEAIRTGKNEEAIKYVEELSEDSHVTHNRMCEWSHVLFTYIGEKLGEEAILDVTRRLMDEVYADRFEQLTKIPTEELIKFWVRALRTHYSKFHIVEDDEKVSVEITSCGSTGRLMQEGKFDTSDRHPINWGTTKKAYPWSFNKVGMPWYCVHLSIENELYKKVGLKMENQFGFQYDKNGNAIDDPCRLIVYKK